MTANISAAFRCLRAGAVSVLLSVFCSFRIGAEDQLLLWKAEHEKLPGTLYLAGSIHLGKPEMYPLDEAYDKALSSSTHLFMETVDPNRQLISILMLKNGFYGMNQKQTLAGRIGEEDFQKLCGLFRVFLPEIKPANLNAMKLWLAFVMLDVAQMKKAGYHEKYGFEEVFLAQEGTFTLLSLEDGTSQIRRLFQPAVEEELAAALHRLDPEKYRQEAEADARDVWKMEESLILRNTGKMKRELPLIHKELLLDRNRRMAEKLYAFMEKKQTGFVLAGAAHFLGEGSIRSLLAEKGCTITRVPSAGRKGNIRLLADDVMKQRRTRRISEYRIEQKKASAPEARQERKVSSDDVPPDDPES